MSTYPSSPRAAVLAWCQAHSAVFTNNALAIGLTPAQAIAFAAAASAAAAQLQTQESAKQSCLAATQQTVASFQNLRTVTGDTVRLIRAFAETAADPGAVYSLAQVPPPAAPSPVPPPAQPLNVAATLDSSTGALTLGWKAANPSGGSGTSYLVRRKLAGESGFAFIGVTGNKRFVDAALPAGPDSVQYTVQGQRADSTGPVSEILTVNFGRAAGGGATIATQAHSKSGPVGEAAPKLAA